MKERPLKARIAEHKKAVASVDQTSKVASHVHHSSHNMDFQNVQVVCFVANYHERVFLEAWHSTLDLNAGNDHISKSQKPTKTSREHKHLTCMATRASLALRLP